MQKRVVVTGLGAVSPLGNQLSDIWNQCQSGTSGIDRITKFDVSEYRSQMAGEVKNFEAPSIVPHKEVKKMDDFTLYAISAAQSAMQDSGLQISEELETEVGVSIGVGMGGLASIENCHEILRTRGPNRISPFFLPMILANMASGHISMLYKARGYNACTTSACSSSNHSIGEGVRIIERGDAKVMITGGAEAAITPLGVGGFSAMRALSTRNDDPTRASRPYDKNRDGFVLGEGAAVLVLEEYEFAKARGAKIYAEVTGYGYSADAHHITSPSVEGPALSMERALKDAKLNAEQVDYINAHGTSTPAGDTNELNAIQTVLKNAASSVSISSTKSMTGHLLGGAGAIEAVLSLLAMQHNFVPPTINIEELDPECSLDVTPNVGKEKNLQVCMSNSFGFGGTNASLVFQKL